MTLSTLDETEPPGYASVDKGAGEIRLTRKDTKDSVALQHWLAGEHRFPNVDVTVPTAGQIGFAGDQLLYALGSSWKTSSFNAEGVAGLLGFNISSTTDVEVAALVTTLSYTKFSFWCAAMCIGHKPTASGTATFYMGLWAPYSSRALAQSTFTLTGGTGTTETLCRPLQFIGTDSTPLAVGTRISLYCRAAVTGISLEFKSDISMVLTSA